eukprot:scaffold12364_cov118-Isochrysis_galbana.AAC.3
MPRQLSALGLRRGNAVREASLTIRLATLGLVWAKALRPWDGKRQAAVPCVRQGPETLPAVARVWAGQRALCVSQPAIDQLHRGKLAPHLLTEPGAGGRKGLQVLPNRRLLRLPADRAGAQRLRQRVQGGEAGGIGGRRRGAARSVRWRAPTPASRAAPLLIESRSGGSGAARRWLAWRLWAGALARDLAARAHPREHPAPWLLGGDAPARPGPCARCRRRCGRPE